MFSITPAWLIRLLTRIDRPILGTRLIPPDASVPAENFPEDEFPVYCVKCEYQLRGLPDRCCPECGQSFDRGRLLVEQYLCERDHALWEHGRIGTLATRISIVVLVFCVAWIVGAHAVAYLAYNYAWGFRLNSRQVETFTNILAIVNGLMWLGQLIALAALIACIAIVGRSRRRDAQKRKRIMAALADERVVCDRTDYC